MPKVANEITRGNIVLVPFPFTDLTSVKVRPALVISCGNVSKTDIIVVFISSVIKKAKHVDDIVLLPGDADFLKTGLKTTSTIKCRKVATLDRTIVLGEIGVLSLGKLKLVDARLKIILGI